MANESSYQQCLLLSLQATATPTIYNTIAFLLFHTIYEGVFFGLGYISTVRPGVTPVWVPGKKCVPRQLCIMRLVKTQNIIINCSIFLLKFRYSEKSSVYQVFLEPNQNCVSTYLQGLCMYVEVAYLKALLYNERLFDRGGKQTPTIYSITYSCIYAIWCYGHCTVCCIFA